MANALNRQIAPGEVLVIKQKRLDGRLAPIGERLFRASGEGFGTSPDTIGSAIGGEWVDDGVKDYVPGHRVQRVATARDLKQAGRQWPLQQPTTRG